MSLRISLLSGLRLLLLPLLWLAAATPAHAFSVDNIRFGTHPGQVRMVLDLSQSENFRVSVMEDPWRMLIDLPSFSWNVADIGRPQGVSIKAVRQGTLQPGISRIVIDFDHPVAVKSAFILPRNAKENKPDRLVIDFARITVGEFAAQRGKTFGKLPVRESSTASSSVTERPSAPPPQKPAMVLRKPANESAPVVAEPVAVANASSTPVIPPPPRKPGTTKQIVEIAPPGVSSGDAPPPTAAASKPAEKAVIVLDPGHGGVDPGAIGANGAFEKNITLAMAKDLKRELEATGRYKVVLTREKDVFLKLSQRVAFARKHEADLFISLHADSINRAEVKGASLYTLSEKASDEQTAMLADRENRADMIAGLDLGTNDEDVATILVDLTMRDTMNQSKFFAGKLVNALEEGNVRLLENPHRHAGFAVLKAPDIPSVLIELGFMSNAREAEQLSRPEYRRNISRALAEGIDAYFTKIARQQRS